jgi:hypothetical protein
MHESSTGTTQTWNEILDSGIHSHKSKVYASPVVDLNESPQI